MAELDIRIAAWFELHRRDLPWRHTSPWGVYVSEIMLQQTPVARVLPAWTDWLDRWPTPAHLADDSVGECLRAWGRLGYPRRALRLHTAAAIMRDRYDGQVPSEEAELLELPGVGPYTAAAVAAFAYGRTTVVVDVNVRRFLSRVLTGEDPAPHFSAAERALAEQVSASLDVPSPTWSAASMEFGALICTARNPQCSDCQVNDLCDWVPGNRPSRIRPAYEGSLRQARGVVLAALRERPRSSLDDLWPDEEQLAEAVETLQADGLLVLDGQYRLPE